MSRAEVVLAGVGGRGVLSAAGVLAAAAARDGLTVVQGELHGMAQRGGAVEATVRIATDEIHGSLIAPGGVDVIVGLEPLEALRWASYLGPDGKLLTAVDPEPNIPDYPPLDEVLEKIRTIPGAVVVDAARLARRAGSPKAANLVMLGAASWYLPVDASTLEAAIRDRFAGLGERLVEAGIQAFRAGRRVESPASAG